MTQDAEEMPQGVARISGIRHRRSPLSVEGTVTQLREIIGRAGASLFAVIDQSGEARAAGLSLRETTLLIFGNPAAGTPLMQAFPLIALDLPLKLLVWEDDAGGVWMTHLSGDWLADRHGLPADLAPPLSAVDAVTSLWTAR